MGLRPPHSLDTEAPRKVLYRGRRAEIGGIIRELVERKTGCEVVEGSVCSDRIHVCLRIPPKYAVSDVMGYLKGKSALTLCDRHPEWRSRIGKDRTFWARGYYVSTVGLNEATINQLTASSCWRATSSEKKPPCSMSPS